MSRLSGGRGKMMTMAVAVMVLGLFLAALVVSWVLWQFLAWPPMRSLGVGLLIICLPMACLLTKWKSRKLAVFVWGLVLVEAFLILYDFLVLHPW